MNFDNDIKLAAFMREMEEATKQEIMKRIPVFLRAIAFVINFGLRASRLVSSTLGKLIDFVDSRVKNTKELTDILDSLDKNVLKENSLFISLDFVNLFPSIPLNFGIEYVINFAELNWSK